MYWGDETNKYPIAEIKCARSDLHILCHNITQHKIGKSILHRQCVIKFLVYLQKFVPNQLLSQFQHSVNYFVYIKKT